MSQTIENHRRKMKVINVGLREFYESLKEQGVEVAHVEWRPPAGGDQKLLRILDKLKGIDTNRSVRASG